VVSKECRHDFCTEIREMANRFSIDWFLFPGPQIWYKAASMLTKRRQQQEKGQGKAVAREVVIKLCWVVL
jgi:hypothetical protein